MENQIITTIKLRVFGLNNQTKELAFREALRHERILRVDTNLEKQLVRVLMKGSLNDFSGFKGRLKSAGFDVEVIGSNSQTLEPVVVSQNETTIQKRVFEVQGMSCASCEVKIERTLSKLPGVSKVDVDAKKATAHIVTSGDPKNRIQEFNKALGDFGYSLKFAESGSRPQAQHEIRSRSSGIREKPKFWELAMLFILVWTIGALLNRLGVLKQSFGVSSGTGFAAALILGLVAGTSQCLAVISGLLLGISAKFREKYGNVRGLKLAQPILLFSAGRIVSYGIFGGLTGLVGQALSPSPFVTGLLTVLAALFMIAIGLNILNIHPRLLLKLQMRAPKGLMRKIHDLSESSANSWTPAVLGAATFFIPCGFTQSLQIYALGSGSFTASASALTGFALGTIPAIFALWYASSAFRGKAGKFFFKFAGAAVFLLGIWNVQNGLTVAGYPLRLPEFLRNEPKVVQAADSNVVFDGNKQIVKMNVYYGGYDPNEFTIKAGVPVRWEISGDTLGCLSVLQVPKLGIRKRLLPNQDNVIEFTPEAPGDLVFSCSMGMFRGIIHVVPTI